MANGERPWLRWASQTIPAASSLFRNSWKGALRDPWAWEAKSPVVVY